MLNPLSTKVNCVFVKYYIISCTTGILLSVWEQIRENKIIENADRTATWMKTKVSTLGRWIGLSENKTYRKGKAYYT